jgi:hypothetical protein
MASAMALSLVQGPRSKFGSNVEYWLKVESRITVCSALGHEQCSGLGSSRLGIPPRGNASRAGTLLALIFSAPNNTSQKKAKGYQAQFKSLLLLARTQMPAESWQQQRGYRSAVPPSVTFPPVGNSWAGAWLLLLPVVKAPPNAIPTSRRCPASSPQESLRVVTHQFHRYRDPPRESGESHAGQGP